MRNIVLVLSGPSGVGKGTIATKLIERNPNLSLSISCTTRKPRVGEQDGREYFFLTREQFDKKNSQNGFLEYSEHFGNCYGTPRDFVEEKLKSKDVLLEIDVNGGLNVKKSYPESVLIMIVPPSIQEIKNRLIHRGTEKIEEIELRMDRIKYELEKQDLYDYTVVNDKLEDAIIELEQIINKEKNI